MVSAFQKPGAMSEYKVSGSQISELIYMTEASEPMADTFELNKERETTLSGRMSKVIIIFTLF